MAVFSLPDGQKVLTVPDQEGWIQFSPDAAWLASIESLENPKYQARLVVRAVASWKIQASVDLESRGENVTFSPDSRYVAVGIGSRLLRLIDVKSGAVVRIDTQDSVHQIAFSPHGRLLAWAEGDDNASTHTVHVRDVLRANDSFVVPQPYASSSLMFAPDSRVLAVVDSRGIQILSVDAVTSGDRRLMDLPIVVRNVLFSQDGRYLAARTDTGVLVWDWHPDSVIAEACRRLSRNLNAKQWPTVTGESMLARLERACGR